MEPFTVVLAVDFSPASAAAMRHAADLARRLDARVILAHALGHAPLDSEPMPDLGDDRASAVETTDDWAEQLRAEGIEVVVDARTGDPKEVILSAAAHHKADLIVMGRRGLGRAQRLLMGSVTRDVLGESRVPVTVVPTP